MCGSAGVRVCPCALVMTKQHGVGTSDGWRVGRSGLWTGGRYAIMDLHVYSSLHTSVRQLLTGMHVVHVNVDTIRPGRVPCSTDVRSRVHVTDIDDGQGPILVGHKVGVVQQRHSFFIG